MSQYNPTQNDNSSPVSKIEMRRRNGSERPSGIDGQHNLL